MTEQFETRIVSTDEKDQIKAIISTLESGNYQKLVCIIEYDDENTGIYVGRARAFQAIELLKFGITGIWQNLLDTIFEGKSQ